MDDIIGDEQSTRVVTKLHEILRPFLLRRIKKDVLVKMPPKREIVVYCGMSSLQVLRPHLTLNPNSRNIFALIIYVLARTFLCMCVVCICV